MASNDNAIYFSRSPISEYENWKHIIDIPDDQKASKYWNIYEVPSNLRKLNEEAYTPQLVSIGPIHHGHKNLNPMQDQKLRYLKSFWGRHVENRIKAMDSFKRFLEDKEEKIRRRYAGNLCDDGKIKKEKLVEMMFLDSVFIMELFLKVCRHKRIPKQKSKDIVETQTDSDDLRIRKQKSEDSVETLTDTDDIILEQPWLNNGIQRDLLLLENQIPFFILVELYNTVVPNTDPDNKHPSFFELAHDYFDRFHTYKKGDYSDPEAESSHSNNRKTRHFTDMIRSFYICKDLSRFEKAPSFRTATKLREAGVSFEGVENKPLLDINFKRIQILSWFLCFGCIPKFKYFKARLKIPKLKVECTTECVLRNLIAFEQCRHPYEPYICNYVSFIDSLIHTKDDVELLVEKEVIVHDLGSDKEVATLVNGLCKHVVADNTCYTELIKELNRHYTRRWYRTMAALRLVYFRDAWRASSTLVATAVLVFTIFNFCRVVRLVLDLEGGYKRP